MSAKNWKLWEVLDLFALSFNDLLFKAQAVHREHFNPNEIQVSSLLSIKTGGCAEDCKYCPQSARYDTGLKAEKLLDLNHVITAAKAAKSAGAQRFCMGAAWTSPKDKDIPAIIQMIESVKSQGLETCMTLGMLTETQAQQLSDAGLDYYNHNIDTSEEYYKEIITTRTYADRIDTLAHIRNVGMKTCCGGIIGMGESLTDRANMLLTLTTLPEAPQSVPINRLVKVQGTPLSDTLSDQPCDDFDFIRTIAVARIMLPHSYVRLSAGREEMSESTQALCFLAGANSIFYGEKLLTTPNPSTNTDLALLNKLGIQIQTNHTPTEKEEEWFEDDDQPTHVGCQGGCSHAHHS